VGVIVRVYMKACGRDGYVCAREWACWRVCMCKSVGVVDMGGGRDGYICGRVWA